MPYAALVLVIIFAVPVASHASVLINEVAWMGTVVNANDEWIELYNDGTETVSLDGWVLNDGGSLSIDLTGTIGQGAHVLLERTDDTTVPDVTALALYTGALANDGRTLTLLRGDGSVEDRVVGGAGWESIGGDNVSKSTPQRTSTGWITGVPTPGEMNTEVEVVVEEEEDVVEEEEGSDSVVVSTHSGGSRPSSKKKQTQPPIPQEPVLALTIKAPKIAYVHQEVPFEVLASGLGKTSLNSLSYTWNFGDTYTGVNKRPTHTFEYPGEYVVVVNGVFAKHNESVRHEIKILPVALVLTRTSGGDLKLRNNSKSEIDLGGFTISGTNSFTFPKMSILKAGGEVTVPSQRVGDTRTALLHDTEQTLVAALAPSATGKTVGTVPLAVKTVSQPKEAALASTSAAELEILKPKETIIQIGNTAQSVKDEGVIKNFFIKIARFLNFNG